MEPIVDKAVQQAQQFERRPESVEGLFSATMIGIKDTLPKSVVSGTNSDLSQPWENIYAKSNKEIAAGKEKASNPQEQARLEVFAEQLKDINEVSPADRKGILQGLKVNDQTMQKLEGSFADVKRMLSTAQFSSAIDKQKDAVQLADGLDQKALSVELNSVKDTIKASPKPEIRAQLLHDAESTKAVMGSPFTERVRLASMQLKSNSEYQARQTLDGALKLNLPQDVWSIPAMANLRDDAQKVRDGLFVKHNLVPLFDRFGGQIKAVTGREDIRMEDLQSAKLVSNDKDFAPFKKFLKDNYQQLTSDHPIYKFSYGITRSDLENYTKQQAAKTNDIAN